MYSRIISTRQKLPNDVPQDLFFFNMDPYRSPREQCHDIFDRHSALIGFGHKAIKIMSVIKISNSVDGFHD